MPNGGSDCCGTCWFNSRNIDELASTRATSGSATCTIRNFAIDDPYYTYCGNHPHRRPEPDSIPIGPVLISRPGGSREVWRASPDTGDIRRHLLMLLANIKERPKSEYPIGMFLDEIVVWQLGEFQDWRAIQELKRIAAFHPASNEDGPFGRTRQALVKLAQEALAKIADHGA